MKINKFRTLITIFLAYLIFMSVESEASSVTIGANPSNAALVREQLASAQNPSQDLSAILNALQTLAPQSAFQSLNDMSGQQYTLSGSLGELPGRQFLRRLYDPLRPLVTILPCSNIHTFCNDFCVDDCWLDADCSVYSIYLAPWFEAGGGGAAVRDRNCDKGLRLDNWDVSGGVQGTKEALTLGIAGSYGKSSVHHNLNGSGNGKTGYAAIYGLYRSCGWYILGDLAYGITKNTVKRHIDINTTHLLSSGKHSIHQVLSYIEGGIDFYCKSSLLQPFLGFEWNGYNRGRFNEKGADPLNLSIRSQSFCTVYSRLGFHSTTEISLLTDSPCGEMSRLSLDFAWVYRMAGKSRLNLRQSFQSFGNSFTIQGKKNHKNGLDAALTLTTDLNAHFQFYAEAIGIYWNKSVSYSFLGGILYTW